MLKKSENAADTLCPSIMNLFSRHTIVKRLLCDAEEKAVCDSTRSDISTALHHMARMKEGIEALGEFHKALFFAEKERLKSDGFPTNDDH